MVKVWSPCGVQTPHFPGVWRPTHLLLGVQEVPGSNPGCPINKSPRHQNRTPRRRIELVQVFPRLRKRPDRSVDSIPASAILRLVTQSACVMSRAH
jgi:hypothetical protein